MTEPIQPQYIARMQRLARQVDEGLNGKRKPGRKPQIGFVLLVPEFGAIENGRVNYISNGQREDMTAMLREYLARLEGRYHDPTEKAKLQ